MAAESADERWPVLIALPAEIDWTNADDLRRKITAAALNPSVSMVIADMTAVTFCDSTGVKALLDAHQAAALCDAEFRLVRPGSTVRRVLDLMGADRMLAIYDSFGDAMTREPRAAV